jgi:hypothetical protein
MDDKNTNNYASLNQYHNTYFYQIKCRFYPQNEQQKFTTNKRLCLQLKIKYLRNVPLQRFVKPPGIQNKSQYLPVYFLCKLQKIYK